MANSPRIIEYQQTTRTPTGQGAPTPFARAIPTADIGRGLNQLGNEIYNAADRAEEETARAWSSDVLAKARLQWTQNFMDRQANAEPGAPDFTPNLMKEYEEYAKTTLEGAPTARSKRFLQSRLSEFKVDLGTKALEFEAKARIDYRNDKFDSAITETQKLMNTDPGQFKVALAEQLEFIDSSALPPVQRSLKRQQAIDKISTSAVWSQIQKSPTRFLENIGFLDTVDPATGKVRKFSGDLNGVTGNAAFDMLNFESRTKMFDQAIRLKAQNDADVDRLAGTENKRLEDLAMKDLWGKLADGKLRRNDIEMARPLISAEHYHSILKANKEGGGDAKSNPGTYRHLQELMYSDPEAAVQYAFTAHRNGLLSNSDLQSNVSHARSLSRQEGPKSEYERSRQYIVQSMDPGPLVQDPVGRSRMAEAVDTFERWVLETKPKDADIAVRSKEIVNEFKFINFSDTVMALPQPRFGTVRRNAGDSAGILKDVTVAGQTIQSKFDSGAISKVEYDNQMALLNRWRKAASGGKK